MPQRQEPTPVDGPPASDEEGDSVVDGGVVEGGVAEDRVGNDAVAGQPSADDDVTDAVERERDELLEQVRRVQADFENYRKRTRREQAERAARATEGLVEELLPVLDNFELALVGMEDTSEVENVRKGVELVFAEFLGALEKAGLERIVAEGAEFDPTEHEAVMTVEVDDPGEPGATKVVETVRTGYKLKGRVVRPAMVKVAR